MGWDGRVITRSAPAAFSTAFQSKVRRTVDTNHSNDVVPYETVI